MRRSGRRSLRSVGVGLALSALIAGSFAAATAQNTQQKPAAGTEVAVGTQVDLQLTGGGGFVDRMTESLAADSGFATLEIAPKDLRARFVEAKVTTPQAAEKVIEMENQQLQETFRLRNLTHARSFRRMVREALAQLQAEG